MLKSYTIFQIGPDWSVIREKCRRCHYQPLLLLYSNPNGTPINPATAPKEKLFINPSTIVRKTSEISPANRRVSSDLSRLEYERRRKIRPSSPESGLVETDSESNISTLKSDSKKSNSNSNIEGSDDTLKARESKEKILQDNDGEDTLKANDHSRAHRKDMVSFKDDRSPKSRRSKSCDWLDESSNRSNKMRIRTRTGSTGSDVTETLKRKHRDKNSKNKKTGLRRIGSAIFQAIRPGVAISHIKTSKKKGKDRASVTSVESNGELR